MPKIALKKLIKLILICDFKIANVLFGGLQGEFQIFVFIKN